MPLPQIARPQDEQFRSIVCHVFCRACGMAIPGTVYVPGGK